MGAALKVIRCTAGVGVVGTDPQRYAMMHQPVEHVGRFVTGRRHDARCRRHAGRRHAYRSPAPDPEPLYRSFHCERGVL